MTKLAASWGGNSQIKNELNSRKNTVGFKFESAI